MTTIQERLRSRVRNDSYHLPAASMAVALEQAADDVREAADEIDRLIAENARLRELVGDWQGVETAPARTNVLVWGHGPIRIGYKDELGNWRAMHHGPINAIAPKKWRHLPERP